MVGLLSQAEPDTEIVRKTPEDVKPDENSDPQLVVADQVKHKEIGTQDGQNDHLQIRLSDGGIKQRLDHIVSFGNSEC